MKKWEDKTDFELETARVEWFRRKYLTRHRNDPSPYLRLSNIDIFTLLELYSDKFPSWLSKFLTSLNKKKKAEFLRRGFELEIGAPFLVVQKQTDELRDKFYKALLSEKNLLKFNLQNHLDTLLFTCLYFHNCYWDHYGLEWNGAIKSRNVNELSYAQQPYLYHHRDEFLKICDVIYKYYSIEKQRNKIQQIDFYSKTIPTTFEDPTYTNWIIKAMIESIISGTAPLQLGREGEILASILKNKGQCSEEVFLKSLESLLNLDKEIYIPAKKATRMVVKKFIQGIHPIFCRLIDSNPNKSNASLFRVYNRILIAFNMDDFSQSKKHNEFEETNRKLRCQISNRMTELFNDKTY